MTNLLTLQFNPWFSIPMAAVIGMVLGSFYTVCVHRYVEEIPMNRPRRSMCPSCNTQLAWFENIPLVSWWALGGKCRHCGERIGFSYVAIELTSVIWAVALAWKMGMTIPWLIYMVFGGLLIFGSFVDLRSYILPDRVTLGGFALVLLVKGFFGWYFADLWGSLQPALIGAGIGGGGFWLLQQFYRILRKEEGLGTGDVKLMLFLGALVGPGGLPFTILASALSALVASLVYMRLPGSKGLKTRIPFGPFLCMGAMLQLLVGGQVLRWYLSLY